MKLYGTITSERASKRQGGNRYLQIRATIDKDPLSELLVGLYADPKTGNVGINVSRRVDHGNEYRQECTELWSGVYYSCHAALIFDPFAGACKICEPNVKKP